MPLLESEGEEKRKGRKEKEGSWRGGTQKHTACFSTGEPSHFVIIYLPGTVFSNLYIKNTFIFIYKFICVFAYTSIGLYHLFINVIGLG